MDENANQTKEKDYIGNCIVVVARPGVEEFCWPAWVSNCHCQRQRRHD
jgi:hypothetical protein